MLKVFFDKEFKVDYLLFQCNHIEASLFQETNHLGFGWAACYCACPWLWHQMGVPVTTALLRCRECNQKDTSGWIVNWDSLSRSLLSRLCLCSLVNIKHHRSKKSRLRTRNEWNSSKKVPTFKDSVSLSKSTNNGRPVVNLAIVASMDQMMDHHWCHRSIIRFTKQIW